MINSTDSINESDEWGKRKSLIEFIMLENRCSVSKAIIILQDTEERRIANELTR